MSRVLYELGGRDGLRYSQFSWRSRLALAHKGLPAEMRPVRVSDKAAIAFSGQAKVPILVDGAAVIADSWKIADYLDRAYAAQPSLFAGEVGHAFAQFLNGWVDRQLLPRLAPLVMVDVVAHVDDEDARHLRAQVEKGFGRSLEALAAGRDTDIVAFRRLLDPARGVLRDRSFLSGAAPSYADYILFSLLHWARLVSDFAVLEPADALSGWCERVADLFDGLARAALRPAVAAAP